jgi:hypothetical protein
MNNNKKISWNKGLHTPNVQALLDNKEIWEENNLWYRRCPTCKSPIPSENKNGIYGCLRSYKKGRNCYACGARQRKQNLIGKKFGKLTVIGEAPSREKDLAPYWKCKCKCGNETEVRGQHLTNGITKSCGELYHRRGKENYSWTGFGEISGSYFASLKKSAKTRKIPFNISIEGIWNKFLEQKRKCQLTGEPLKFQTKIGTFDGTASLDRIDSSKGYTIDNVQWVDKRLNKMKLNLNEKEFIDLCHKVSSYNITKNL